MEFQQIKFTLPDDPQEYTLTYDFNEMCDAEPIVGMNLLTPIAGADLLSTRDVRGLLYALLKKAHPMVLLPEAGELMTKNLPVVTNKVIEMLGLIRSGERAKAPEPEVKAEPKPETKSE